MLASRASQMNAPLWLGQHPGKDKNQQNGRDDENAAQNFLAAMGIAAGTALQAFPDRV
jgi:hypothetical protein